MKPNRTNLILIGLLVLQIVVGVALTLGNTRTVESSRGPLLTSFAPDAVSKIVITDGSDKTRKPLTIAKNEQGYVLPEFDNYPVDFNKAFNLANTLRNLDTRRLIAQNKASQTRLKVAPEAFDRQIALRVGDKDVMLYLGAANEASAAYARLGDSDAVYLPSGISVYDLSANPVSWVNPAYLTLTTDEIAALTVQNAAGTFAFKRENGAWTLADAALNPGERFNPDAVNALITQLGTVSLSAPIDAKADEKLGMAKPAAVITIQTRKAAPPTATPPPTATTAVSLGIPPAPPVPPGPTGTPVYEEKTYTLQIGAKLENGDYALKSSESAFYVQVAPAFAMPFIDLNREKVLILPPTATPTSTPFGPIAPPTNPVTPTISITIAATSTATGTPTSTSTP